MEEIADVIASLFRGTTPYVVEKRRPKYDYRARVDFDVLEEAKVRIAALAAKAADPYDVALETGYPHFYFINDKPKEVAYGRLSLEGRLVKPFVDWLTPSDTAGMAMDLAPGDAVRGKWHGDVGCAVDVVDERTVTLDVPSGRASRVVTWLRALVDGYAATDDAFGRLTFLDAVRDLGTSTVTC